MQYTAIFHGCKNVNFQMKKYNVFLIFAQNIDCGYMLEPPHRGGSNEYPRSMFWSKNKKKYVYPCKPQFYYMKVGCKGVLVTRTCFRDVGSAFSHSMASCDTMLQYDTVLWGTVQSKDFSPVPLPQLGVQYSLRIFHQPPLPQLVISEPPCDPTLLPLTFPAVVPPGIVLDQKTCLSEL